MRYKIAIIMTKKLRFALFGNVYQPKKSTSVIKLLAILEQHEALLFIDRPFYEYLTKTLQIDVHCAGLIDGSDFLADFCISMGGDGTFLAAARRVGNKNIPILGINMGRLGFLSDYSADDIQEAIEQIYQGNYRMEERSVLQVSYDKGETKDYPYALNEVAILKTDNSSMISLRVDINGEYLTTYQADGLIINTPTGSTGYALSVGGPVMAPGSDMIGLVPVAPHSLTARPLMLEGDMEISLTVETRNHKFLVSIDGRSETCPESTRITIHKAPYNIRVMKHASGSFFRTLRQKLMWGTDVRE